MNPCGIPDTEGGLVGSYQRIRRIKETRHQGRTKIKTLLLNISGQRFQQTGTLISFFLIEPKQSLFQLGWATWGVIILS